MVPLTILTGSTVDISPLLRFTWWERVYYMKDDSSFPSDSKECSGRFVGIAESVGHYMTFKILDDETKRVIHRSNVRSAEDPQTSNRRIDKILESLTDPVKQVVKGPDYMPNDLGEVDQMPTFHTADLIGRTFLLPKDQETHERFRARVVAAINKHKADLEKDPTRMKFLCSVNNDKYETVMSYNDIVTQLADDNDELRVWKFRKIVSHQGPIPHKDPTYIGSK